jgi:hypothetical protein
MRVLARKRRNQVTHIARQLALHPLKTNSKTIGATSLLSFAANAAAFVTQCADKLFRPKGEANASSLYLAFLIGRTKSTLHYAFLRFLQTSSAPYLAASIASSVRHQHGRDLHSPGGVHAFLRVRHRAVACSSSGSSTGLSKQSGALVTMDGSRQEIADIPRFAAPPGDAHRARGSRYWLPFSGLAAEPTADISSLAQ